MPLKLQAAEVGGSAATASIAQAAEGGRKSPPPPLKRKPLKAAAGRDPLLTFWSRASWSIIEDMTDNAKLLALARWRHLHGQFDKNDEEDCQRPKGNTAKGYKSHLKMLIKKYSDGEYDITNQVQFEKFDVSNSKLKLVG